MTASEFLKQCEATLGSGKVKLLPAQESIYFEKLRRFTSDQLLAIYDKVLETTGYFPKIKDIYEAARDLGYLQTESEHFKPHRWQETECQLCKGEGRLCITWIVTSEIIREERREVHALSRIRPYAESCNSDNFVLESGEFRSIFRCSCLAGDAAGIPKMWPKWSKSMPAVRYV